MFIGFADKVLTVGNTIAEEYVRLYGIAKPAIILNAPSYKTIEKKNIFRKTFGIREDQTIFLYQGGLTVGRGIEVLLDTFEAMGNDKGVIVFMGYGYLDKLIKEKAEKNNNIFFHPAVTPDVLLNYTSSADFGISTIEDCSLSDRYSLPNKMFEYLMVELPVIVSNLPEMKKFVQDSGIGVVVKNNNVNGVKEACQDAMGMDKAEIKENLKKAKEIYNWEEQEKILLKVYSEV
jgi:glycosyltransferase involved in cell wall biosynthesis